MTGYEELAMPAVLALESMANPGLTWGDLITLGIGLLQCGLIAWGIWVMRGSNESRAATNQLMIAQSKALADIGAGIREQVELSRAQRAEQSEQSAGIRALLERSQQP